MIAVNYSTFRNDLKNYCDKATDLGETIIVTRKEEKNVVILSLEQYNDLIRQKNNAAYMGMLQKSMAELTEGNIHLLPLDEIK